MSVKKHIDSVNKLCKTSSERILRQILNLGPRPDDSPAAALLWDQHLTRLQGQLNSLTAMVSKLTALAIIEGLEEFESDLQIIDDVAKEAQKKIKKIKEISSLLEKTAQVLDLGLAVIAAAAAPTPMTVSAAVNAASNLAQEL